MNGRPTANRKAMKATCQIEITQTERCLERRTRVGNFLGEMQWIIRMQERKRKEERRKSRNEHCWLRNSVRERKQAAGMLHRHVLRLAALRRWVAWASRTQALQWWADPLRECTCRKFNTFFHTSLWKSCLKTISYSSEHSQGWLDFWGWMLQFRSRSYIINGLGKTH